MGLVVLLAEGDSCEREIAVLFDAYGHWIGVSGDRTTPSKPQPSILLQRVEHRHRQTARLLRPAGVRNPVRDNDQTAHSSTPKRAHGISPRGDLWSVCAAPAALIDIRLA